MRLCINEATCKENSTLERDLALCEKYGFDFIEMRLDMIQDYLKDHTLDDLKAFFAKSHVRPYALNSIEDINFCPPAKEKEVLALFTFACEVARAVGNPYIVVVPTVRDDMPEMSDAAIHEDSVRMLRRLSDMAQPYGAQLAFEPIGNPRWCVRSLPQAMAIIDAVDRGNVGLTVDAFNLYLHRKFADIDLLDRLPPEKIFVYHINDSEDRPLTELDHCHRLMPGDGFIPLKEISKKLKAKGYDGPASVELFRPQYWSMDADEVFRTAAEKTKPYL